MEHPVDAGKSSTLPHCYWNVPNVFEPDQGDQALTHANLDK